MKKLITLSILFFGCLTQAQTKALTDDGKEVVLFDNGTWNFVNDSDTKTLETITTNENIFTKDKNATFLFRSKKIDAGIYINPKVWKNTNAFKSPTIEYAFINNLSNNIFGIFATENVEISSLKNLKDILVSSTQSRADYYRLKESEYRTVNGLKVLYLWYVVNTKGLDFEYVTYSYLTNNGYCAITGYTFAKNFEESKPQLMDLLNGLVETQKAEVKETVEVYQSPPPPMQNKKKD